MKKSFVPLMGFGVLGVIAVTLLQLLLTGPNTQLHTLPQPQQARVSVSELLSQPEVVRGVSTPLSAPSLPPEALPEPSPGPPPRVGDGVVGKNLFNGLCTLCHPGGGKGVGPSLMGVGQETLFQTIRKGRGAMPPVGASLSEKEVMDLWAYVQTLRERR